MSFVEDFGDHLRKFPTSPFLFIGSGLSRRYLRLPTWKSLLETICDKLKLPKPFEYYYSNAQQTFPMIASLIGKDFNDMWWTSDEYLESRHKYQSLAKSPWSPIKFEISKFIESYGMEATDVSDEFDKEIALLKKAVIDGVITTNWDMLIESLFPDFVSFIGQEQLMFSEIFAVGELYKIHGSVTDPETLILTKDDYDEFHDRYSYLAAKLLTIFVEHPIVFLGYSLDDYNVQLLLKAILKCLSKEKVERLRDRLIFCQWNPMAKKTEMTDSTILISETLIPIKLISMSTFTDVYSVLADNKKRLPVKVLRQMKGMVHDFVKSSDPKSRVFVSDDLDALESAHDVQFVYGVGLKEKFPMLV